MEREAVLVGIDVGTSKVCALIGEVSRDGRLTIMGHGTVPASGLKKGVVINIDQTVRSIADAVERAERLSGWKIDRAFVGVGGQHVESLNSPGQVAVTGAPSRGHPRGRQPGDRGRPGGARSRRTARCSTSSARASRVDGQEGVKDPLGMSALRLEVETHIVTAVRDGGPEPVQVRRRGRGQDRRAGGQRAGVRRRGADRDREGAGRRRSPTSAPGRSTSRCSRTARRSTPGSCRSAATTSPTTSRSGSRPASRWPRSSRSATARATCGSVTDDEEISVSVLGEDAGRTVSRLEVCQIIEARMRETFELMRNEIRAAGRRACCRPGSS